MGAPVLVPVMVGIGCLIKVVSAGPIFFRQERVGYGGSRFICWKFRTMHHGSDTQVHQDHFKELIEGDRPMEKLDSKNDPRLIWGGSWLRCTGLDELPQVFNIILGEMSWVGPRPCTPYEYDLYDESQRRRFEVLPGLTGLWQVCGKNRTTFRKMVELDIEYVQTRSIGLDVSILIRTIPTIVFQVKEKIFR